MEGRPPVIPERRFLTVAAALGLASLFLRVYQIGQQELWVDEAFSFHVATATTRLAQELRSENSPPLYYLLLRLWLAAAGTSEAGIRLLSTVFGTLFVLAVIWAGRTFFDARVGLWAGGIAAVSPIHIYYSQEGRTYSMLLFLILVTYLLLWRALERNTWRSWVVVSVSASLALYSHYLAILALLPTVVLVVLWPGFPRAGPRWRGYLGAVLLAGLLVLPWIWWSLVIGAHWLGGMDWIRMGWEQTPPALAIPKTLEIFAFGSQAGFFPPFPKVFPRVTIPFALRLLGLVVLGLLAVWIAVPWMDQRLEIPWFRRRKAWLWTMLLLPLGALWLVSLYRPVYLVGRYDMIAFPAFVLLLGLALAKVQAVEKVGLPLVLCVALALFWPVGVKLGRYYEAASLPSPGALSPKAAAAALARTVDDGDVVVFTGLRGMRVLYYLNRLGIVWRDGVCHHSPTGRRFGCRMFPLETEQHPAVDTEVRVVGSSSAVREDLETILSGLSRPEGKLWILFQEGSYVGTQILVPEPDASLVDVLEGMGFHFTLVTIEGAAGVFQATR